MELKEFLNNSYTCYHAAKLGAQMLEKAGFADIDSNADFKKAAGAYRVCGGCLLAVKKGNDKINLVLSHTDSPSLRLRTDENASAANSITLSTEKYGGGLLRSYFDRKMKIAGRVILKQGNALVSKCVSSDYNVIIPSLAVHLGAGKEGETFSVSRDMRPLAGDCENLCESLGAADAVDSDLFCVPAEEAYDCGVRGEYVCSPRIDNLVSVYASLRALIDCKNVSSAVAACYNSEETGSETREGAEANMLEEFLQKAFAAFGQKADARSVLRSSFALSCDGAHALHPNRKEVYSDNAPVLGGGVAIKRNDRYATDALTCAAAREIFARAGVSVQTYRHHADMRCGSTIGLTAAHTLGCAVCDIGVAQLAMHSAVETAAKKDIAALRGGLTKFFESDIAVSADRIEIK